MERKTTTRKRAVKKPAPPLDELVLADGAEGLEGIELDLPRLRGMIEALLRHLEAGELKGKATIADLVRLLQLYKDLSNEQIKEVEVRWVDRIPKDENPGS